LSLYLDTSLIVAALTYEPRRADVWAWLDRSPVDELATSDWVAAEVSAALSIKVRTKALSPVEQSASLRMFAMMEAKNLLRLDIPPAVFRNAARLADRHEAGLRAGDALHLAVCAHHQAKLCTLDKKLAEAGSQLGVETLLL